MREVEARLKLSAVDRTGNVLSKIGKQMQDVNRRAQALNRQNNALASSSHSTIMALGRIAGPVAVAYGVKKSVEQFAEVEKRIERIGITADATAQQTDQLQSALRRQANDLGLTFDEATAGLDTLVASGQDLKGALSFLPSVLATAQATGAATEDVANTALKTASAFGITADRMNDAFDIMVAGGKAGQFELKDMAQYIPQLSNSFATLGYKGEDGLKDLIAILQTLREDTGDASTAATYAQNVFGKIYSNETAGAFKKMGVDLRKEMDSARKNGEKTLDAFVRITRKATGGDMTKLAQLFGDQQMREAMTSLLTSEKSLQRFLNVMNGSNVKGTVMRDVGRLVDLTDAKIKRLESSWDGMVNQIGAQASDLLAPAMDALSKQMQGMQDYRAGMNQLGSDPELLASQQKEFFQRAGDAKLTPTVRASLKLWDDAVAAVGRGEIKSPLDFINQRVLATDANGVLAENYGKYRRATAGPNPMQVASGAMRADGPWTVFGNGERTKPGDMVLNPPIPPRRPTKAEMDAEKTRAGYEQARGLGRDFVAARTREAAANAALAKDFKDVNGFSTNFGVTPQQVLDHQRKLLERFPGRRRRNPGLAAMLDVSPSSLALRDAQSSQVYGDAWKVTPGNPYFKADYRQAEMQAARDQAYPVQPKGVLSSFEPVTKKYRMPWASNQKAEKPAANLEQTLREMSSLTMDFESSGKAAGKAIEDSAAKGGSDLERAAGHVAAMLIDAANKAAAAISAAKPAAAPAAIGGQPAAPKVNANTGKTNGFVNRPATGGGA